MSPIVPIPRRGALRGLVALVSGTLVRAGCRREPAGTRVTVSDIPPGGRLETQVEGVPVELRRAGDEIRARSLLCTHLGCRLQWREADASYHCPCHAGRFDAEGRPVAGPPRRPLTRIPVRLEDGHVVLGEGAS